jgi:hypothetical protein
MNARVDPIIAIDELDILVAELCECLALGSQGTRRESDQVLRDIAALTADLAATADCLSQQRLPLGLLRAERCRDCGVAQGELHGPDCFQERCATCGGQAVLCLHRPRRRVPFIAWANVCASCGQLGPALFDVPHRVWRHYIEPAKRQAIICEPCFTQIADLTDGRTYLSRYGEPVPLWSPEFRRRHGIPPDVPSPWDGSTEAAAPP